MPTAPSSLRFRGRGLLIVLLALTGCFPDGPEDVRTRVHDLRVLACRMDPPELELPLAPDAPDARVEATVLLALPDRMPATVTVTGCPFASDGGCQAFDPSESEDPTVWDPLIAEETRTLDADAAPGSPDARPVFERRFPVALMTELLTESGFSAVVGARPALAIDAVSDDGFELAFKRLQISFPDLAYRAALAELEVPICDDTGGPSGCIPWRTKVANTNPVIEEIRLDHRGENVVAGEAPFVVSPGDRVGLLPQASPTSAEAYQTLTIDFDARELVVEDREELLTYSWFATAGGFAYGVTEEDLTLGTGNAWFAPSDTGPAFVWVVLRDTRGGVDFRALSFSVE